MQPKMSNVPKRIQACEVLEEACTQFHRQDIGWFVHLMRLDKGDKRKILSRKFDPDVILAISGSTFCSIGLRKAPNLRRSNKHTRNQGGYTHPARQNVLRTYLKAEVRNFHFENRSQQPRDPLTV